MRAPHGRRAATSSRLSVRDCPARHSDVDNDHPPRFARFNPPDKRRFQPRNEVQVDVAESADSPVTRSSNRRYM